MLAWFVLLPLVVLLLLNLLPLGGARRVATSGAALCLGLLQVIVVVAHPGWLTAPSAFQAALPLGLELDALGRVLLLSIGVVVPSSVLIGHFTLRQAEQQSSFGNLMLVSLVGMNGAVLLTDLFSLYVFIEVIGVASFVLIALERGREAVEGAFRYLLLSAVAGVMLLGGVALFVLYCGGTSFAAVKAAMTHSGSYPVVAYTATGLYLSGLLVKSGLVPFHAWVPGAYSAAPAGVSVLLAGVGTKAGGVYALVRLCHHVLGPHPVLGELLMVLGIISIFVGAIAAVVQGDLKRMLAYSSISQIGYIVLALGCGTPLALAGALFHLFNHAVFKALLFSNSAAVESRLGSTEFARMGGLGKQMPVTGVTSLVALLSTAGIPPLSGFWSKLLIVLALWNSGLEAYAVLAVLGSLFTLGYFLVMERLAFFGQPGAGVEQVVEARAALLVPAVVLSLVTVGLGVLFPLLSGSFLLFGQGLSW